MTAKLVTLAGFIAAAGAIMFGHHAGSAPAAATKRCPGKLLQLPADGAIRAGQAALRQAPRFYPAATSRTEVSSLALAKTDLGPEEQGVGKRCGRRTQNRSVVVHLRFPEQQSASMSQGTVVVGRFADGYRIYDVLH